MQFRHLSQIACLVLASWLVTGCVTSPAEYERVADQGADFQDSYLRCTEAARDLNLAARTLSMTSSLEGMAPGPKRLETYQAYLPRIATGLTTYNTIRDHSAGMRSYFKQLQNLASSNAATDSQAAAADTIKSINGLAQKLNASGISSSTGTIVGELVKTGVSIRQRRLLAQELQAHGESIEANLLLQVEALAYLEKQVASDLTSTANEQANLLELKLLEADALDSRAVVHSATTHLLASTTKPDSAHKAAESLVANWRSLIRRARGDLTLPELYAALKELSAEIRKMEATTAAISGALK